MNRRGFLKLSIFSSSLILMPTFGSAKDIDIDSISFSKDIYDENGAQSVIIFLYGGASQLNGNLTNLDEIEKYSQKSHRSYFSDMTVTTNGCWQEAGGEHMEKMLEDGDMTLYRCCYSEVRDLNNNRAHGICTEQNQKGSFDTSGGGIVANIASILYAKGAISENAVMPFISMEGDSIFYIPSNIPIPTTLKPVGIDENFDNPYERTRWSVRNWTYYTPEERENDNYNGTDEDGGFDPALTAKMDEVAQSHNSHPQIKDNFATRAQMADFINKIKDAPIPSLGEDEYIEDDLFADKLKAAIKILDNNEDTKIITLNTGGLGGWDDHNEARDYVKRSESLFRALRSAVAHIKAIEKEDKINIIVFAEFGRNVNLNLAYGWDHGNLQNVYVFGGKKYFSHKGVVGETVVDNTGVLNRLWLKPKDGTYWFEPMSIATTLYKIYGIQNPELLTTSNYEELNVLNS